jgi:hypothetical protein
MILQFFHRCPVGDYIPVREDIHYHVTGTERADHFFSPFPFSLSVGPIKAIRCSEVK